jgi:hypothetical protein
MLVISILLVPALASKLTEAPNALVWLFERERVLKSFASLSFSAPSFKIFKIEVAAPRPLIFASADASFLWI